MKTLFLLITTTLFSISAMAGNGPVSSNKHPNKYCAKLKDGKLMVMHEGKAIVAEVTLANGTKIQSDGTIVKKDGSVVILKEGECIDHEGKIMAEDHKYKKTK